MYTYKGFMDEFSAYANTVHGPAAGQSYDHAFYQVRQVDGNTIRFNVNWAQVQANGPDHWDWGPYWSLGSRANAWGLRLIPVIVGVPEWASPWWNGLGRYPSPNSISDFANFTNATAWFFKSYTGSQLNHIEVWNEPNLYNTIGWFGPGPSGGTNQELYRSLLVATIDRINASWPIQSDGFQEVQVLGGSVSMGDGDGWEQFISYVGDSQGTCLPFGMSIHPYSKYANAPNLSHTPSEAANRVRDQIQAKVDTAISRTTRDIWVTETGCPSKPPFNESGQALAVERISAALAARARCKAMLLYRLYNWNYFDPQGSAYDQYPITRRSNGSVNDGWGEKSACQTLRTVW